MLQNERSLKASLAVNTTAQIVARAVSAVTTFIITMIIARRFGADGFGDFVKITTYVAFFYLIADFGFNAIYLQRRDAWEDLLVLRLIVSSLLVLAACAILVLLPHGSAQGYTPLVRTGILLFLPSIVLTALTTTGNALFQKYLRYDLSAIAVTAGSLASLVFVSIATTSAVFNQTIVSVTTAILVGTAVTTLVALSLTRTLERVHHTVFSLPRIWFLFAASIPLGLTLLFNLVYFHVDSIILTLTRSTWEVGIYGLAYKVFELTLVFPTFFMNALYPIMLGSQEKKLKKVLIRSSVFLLLISFFSIGVLWIGAPILTLVRNDFASCIPVLRVLSVGLPFFFLSSLTMWILIARKKQMLLLVIYGISMIINIALNSFYIPSYGYMAAAWITVASEALVLLISCIVIVKIYNTNS
jgi:O-antigen/teichoic acid export membrane protein